jgi:hypothetical protein
LITKITGAEYPLAKIFSSDFDYEIPSYQRPYAWKEEQTGELFDDLYTFFENEPNDTYFLGSIVLIKEDAKPRAEVIDGQQRLTTLTILFAVIASRLSGEAKTDAYRYVREPGSVLQGLESKPRLALRERDRAFFAKYVQSLEIEELLKRDSGKLENEAQANILKNTALLVKRIDDEFEGDEKRIAEFGSFLVRRCYIVTVSTPSQHSAFRVFSVLNSRGLDLLPTDIIKADVIGRIPPKSQDKYTKRWEDLEVETGRDDFAELFSHIRTIYAKTKARKNLLEEFREYVMKKGQTSESLISDVIEPYAEAYLIAKNQSYTSSEDAGNVNEVLYWLNRIDNSDWLPTAIAFLSQSHKGDEQVFSFISNLERLGAFMHVCGKNVNWRIDRYGQVLTALEKSFAHSAHMKATELTVMEKKEFLGCLDGEVYFLPSRRRNYLLQRLDSFLSDGAATYKPGIMTVEHVLPQTVPASSDWEDCWPEEETRKRWLHRLANLVPLTQKRNSAAQNYNFDKKKAAYFGGSKGISSYVLTTQVLNTTTWTPKVVKKRQADLIALLTDKWRLG